jgi:hypothetical protein
MASPDGSATVNVLDLDAISVKIKTVLDVSHNLRRFKKVATVLRSVAMRVQLVAFELEGCAEWGYSSGLEVFCLLLIVHCQIEKDTLVLLQHIMTAIQEMVQVLSIMERLSTGVKTENLFQAGERALHAWQSLSSKVRT